MTRTRRVEGGTATAELAVAVPVLVAVLALALSAVRLGVDGIRVVDAAHAAARVAARSEGAEAARRTAQGAAPAGARVEVSVSGTEVVVTVRADPPALLRTVGVDAGAEATAGARLESVVGAVP